MKKTDLKKAVYREPSVDVIKWPLSVTVITTSLSLDDNQGEWAPVN